MGEKMFEVRIRQVATLPRSVRRAIIDKVTKDRSKYNNFKGFAKITYVTASPKSIKNVEPINGNVAEYFETYKKENGVDFNVF